MIFSIMSMFMTFGAAIGSPTAGFIYDKTGSYRGAWLLLIGVAAIGLVLTVFSVGKKKKSQIDTAA